MEALNNWKLHKIINKKDIKEFEFLAENGFVQEIQDEYYYLSAPLHEVERKLYEQKNEKLLDELCVKDVKKEIKDYIKKLNSYNEAKDVAECLMGKIADLKGTAIKEIHEEMEINFDTG